MKGNINIQSYLLNKPSLSQTAETSIKAGARSKSKNKDLNNDINELSNKKYQLNVPNINDMANDSSQELNKMTIFKLLKSYKI